MANSLYVHEIGNPDTLKRRIAEGVDVNRGIGEGLFPLHCAIQQGWVESCAVLLETGADPEKLSASFTNHEVYSPLWFAVHYCLKKHFDEDTAIKMIGLLLQHGANPSGVQPTTDYPSPLLAAASNRQERIVEALIAAGADVNGWGLKGKVSRAKRMIETLFGDGNQNMALKFLRSGADDKYLEQDGYTPFQQCVRKGMDQLVLYYLNERGEDPWQCTASGRSMLRVAKNESTKAIFRSYKTDMVVQNALDVDWVDGATNKEVHARVAPQKSRGFSPL